MPNKKKLILLTEVGDVNTYSSHRHVIRNMFLEVLCVWPNTLAWMQYIYCKLIGAADARLRFSVMALHADVLPKHSWLDWKRSAGDGLSHNKTDVLYPNKCCFQRVHGSSRSAKWGVLIKLSFKSALHLQKKCNSSVIQHMLSKHLTVHMSHF